MNARSSSLSDALNAFVPPFEPDTGDWEGIIGQVALAEAPRKGDAGSRTPHHRWTRRRSLIAVIIAALAATLVVTPAFGLHDLILGLIGRTNVPFTGQTAPLEIKRNFFDLGLGLPPSVAPEVIASESRRVATFRSGGTTHVLWVAPTRHGGFCWTFSHGLTGCLASRGKSATHIGVVGLPTTVHSQLLGVSIGESMKSKVRHVSQISGDILTPNAYSLTAIYEDGTQTSVPFYYVSKPIDAGFFFFDVPAGHATVGTRLTRVELRDKAGHLLAGPRFSYPTAAEIAQSQARMRAMLKKMKAREASRKQHPAASRSSAPKPPALPAPTAPLQQGEAGGVTVTAGHNGVVVFDTGGATASVKKLLAGLNSYGCAGALPYHPAPADPDQGWQTLPRITIRVRGVHPPYLGCDIGGSYGNTWPARLHGHKPVEIAFSPAGARYFANRAAARDLALFVRSKAMHSIRKLSGDALEQAIHNRYGSQVTRLRSVTALLEAGRVGYAVTGDTSTFIEQSTTGHRFYVRVVDGTIKAQNLEELGFVF